MATGTLAASAKAVAILGAGSQGRRLAFMWSRRGGTVNLIDPQLHQLNESTSYIEDLRKSSRGPLAGKNWGTIKKFHAKELSDALADAWLVIECVPENLAFKKSVIEEIDKAASSDAIVASNSSSFTISEIIQGLTLKHPERALSAHCYWPPETSAIELMGTDITKQELIFFLMQKCKDHGFSPFHVKRDSNGYIYNRIWAAIKREALLVVKEGVATPAEVDGIFKDVLKTPKGPCEQMDIVGLDVVLDIEEHYAEQRSGLPKEPRDLLKQMVSQNRLGVKTGHGFYEYR